jgi:hypothetical protein
MRQALLRTPLLAPLAGAARYALANRATLGAVLADLAATRRDWAKLLAAPVAPPNGRTALVLALADEDIYQMKLYAMLALGLRRAGWRLAVLQDHRARALARSFYRALGFTEFAHLADFAPDAAARAAIDAAVRDFAARADDFPQVKAWTYQGAWIGPQILSTLSRRDFAGAPDPRDPAVRAELKAALPGLLAHAAICRAAARALKPDLALVVEANYATSGPMVDAVIAEGGGVVQLTQPWKDDALILKRLTPATRRHHPSSLDPETFARIQATTVWDAAHEAALDQAFADRYGGRWFLQARNQPGTVAADRAAICAQFGIPVERSLAVVFSHVLWDANLFYGEDLFRDYADWFVATVRAACANPNASWLVKMHPANLWKRAWENVTAEHAETRLIREAIGPLPDHVRLVPPDTSVSTLSLFQAADCAITVRGTTGMEAPCHGLRVLTAGTGRYSGLGFTDDFATADAYLAALARVHDLGPLEPERVRLARLHAHAVFCRRPWTMTGFRSAFDYPRSGSHPLAHNLAPVAAADVADLDRFAAWAGSAEVDYLEPA